MKTALRSAFLTLAITLTLLASAGRSQANPEVFEKGLKSTGLILVPLGDGKDNLGTCWVIDREKKLVITNDHVVRDKKHVDVYFPMFAGGELVTVRDTTLKQGKMLKGEVLRRDIKRDLALVRLDTLPEGIQPLPLAPKSPRPGETLHSIGNSGYNDGILWRYTRGEVRCVAPVICKLNNGNTINATVIETQAPINPGDSGGPVLNERGELVGVVSNFSPKDRLISLNIDVREVRAFLAEPDRVENNNPAPVQPGGLLRTR